MKAISIHLPLKPLSVNEAWQGKRYRSDKYLKFTDDFLLLAPKKSVKFSDMLSVTITYGFSNANSDIDNPCKPVLDLIKKKYGIDDRYIYELIQHKKIVAKGKEYIDITIENYLPFY